MPGTINERFRDFQVVQGVRWYRLGNQEVAASLEILNRVDKELTQILYAGLQDAHVHARLEALKAQVTNLLNEMHRLHLAPHVERAVLGATSLAAEVEMSLFGRVLPAGLDLTTPNLGILQTAPLLRPFNGAVLGEWVNDLRAGDLKRTWRTILDGVVSGESTDDLIRRVIGSPSLRYKDGVREVTRRGVQALVRTSVTHATNVGRQLVWESNEDLVKAVQWVSTLDTRTSAICRYRDGSLYPVGEGPRPPAHPNCRSTTVSVLKSWEDLGIEMDELPEGTRASMNGQVPESTTYYQWLERQSAATQREVLGPTRYELWKEGGVSPDRFHADRGHYYTIEELRRKMPEAFKEAGL